MGFYGRKGSKKAAFEKAPGRQKYAFREYDLLGVRACLGRYERVLHFMCREVTGR